MSLATEEQLLDLASLNENAVVRLYAFQALKLKNLSISIALREQFKNDQTVVMMLNSCLENKMTINELAKQNPQLFASVMQ